jgi:glucose-6-phosphate isomerase
MTDSFPFVIGDQSLVIEEHKQTVVNRLGHMQGMGFVDHFWQKDGRLWERAETDPAITGTMGWIRIAETMKERIPELQAFAKEVKAAGFTRAVLAGMGGSSLAPLVLSEVLYEEGKGIPVDVLDSTDPATILRIERAGPLDKTLFMIASKSGSTAEPTAFEEYFYDQVSKVKENPGENFVAITDPGSDLEKSAKAKGFRHTFLNFADIGGRFSALTYFGLVPAAVMDLDLEKLLDRAIDVINENQNRPAQECDAFVLGAVLGDYATSGVNKLTFILPEKYAPLGLWLEQLVAESTGKEGKGILPVAGEEIGSPSEYGKDRFFAYFRPTTGDHSYLDGRIASLRDGGWPGVRITLNDEYDIGREFMRWELATAVAGSVIGINPFDQPNVQEAKDTTKKILAEVETKGRLPMEEATVKVDSIHVYGKVEGDTLDEITLNFFKEAHLGDFFTIMAYLTESPEMTHALTKLQEHIRDCTCLATTKGYGPRFLHSTGQFHKGGPNTGHFIQLTQRDREDAPLPGRSYTFRTFRNAQALGDRQTLEARGRRVIRFHLGSDPVNAVEIITRAVSAHPTVVPV